MVVVEVNTGPERIGHVTMPNGQITIIQSAGNCVTAIAPTSQAFDANGGAGTISVTAVPGCAWDATSHNLGGSSLVTPFTAHGIGSGVVPFTIGANKDLQATAPFFIIGGSLKFQITQKGCPLTVSPTSFHVPAAAADYFVSVTTGAVSCDWSASSNEDGLKPGDVVDICGYLPKEPIMWQIASADAGAVSLSGRLINGETMVMPDGHEQSWGDYGVHKCFASEYRDQHSK